MIRRSIVSLVLALSCMVTGVVAQVANACGVPKPHPAGQCDTPTPPPATATSQPTVVPPTSTPAPVTPSAVVIVQQPIAAPAAQPAASAAQNAALSGPGGRTDVCVYSLENGNLRVDIKPVADSNRWVAEHTGRADLPDDFIPARGQQCGVTLILPTATATAQLIVARPATPSPTATLGTVATTEQVPDVVTPTPVAQPCWQTDENGQIVFNPVEDETTGDVTYIPAPCGSTPAQPQPEIPTSLPKSGDPNTLDNCAPQDNADWWLWWINMGKYICP